VVSSSWFRREREPVGEPVGPSEEDVVLTMLDVLYDLRVEDGHGPHWMPEGGEQELQRLARERMAGKRR
jgi:hypothetical protein